MEQTGDLGLIKRCKDGVPGAFDELTSKYYKKVLNVAYRLVNDYDEANDIAQEVFVRAFKAIKGFREEAGVFTWLYRITVNLSKNRLKVLNKDRRRLESLDDPIITGEGEIKKDVVDDRPSPSEVLAHKESGEAISAALASLDSDFREVIVLRDIENFSYEEIARILRVNVGTVKSRLHRARMTLGKKLKGVLE